MNKTRLRQFLALFLVLCMLCSTALPIYAEVSTGDSMPVETTLKPISRFVGMKKPRCRTATSMW